MKLKMHVAKTFVSQSKKETAILQQLSCDRADSWEKYIACLQYASYDVSAIIRESEVCINSNPVVGMS